MFMVLKKKQMIISALVIMLGIAGYLNYKYDDTSSAIDVLNVEDQKTENEIGDVEMVNSSPVETPAETFVAAIFTIPFLNSALSREDTVMPTKGKKMR